MKEQPQERKSTLNIIKFFVFAAVATSVIVLSLTGCEEANQAGSKKTRLIAAENIKLKKQFEQCSNELGQKKTQLKECIQERDKFKRYSDEKTGALLESIMEPFRGETKKLEEENKALKSEIQALKSQLGEAKRDPNSQSP